MKLNSEISMKMPDHFAAMNEKELDLAGGNPAVVTDRHFRDITKIDTLNYVYSFDCTNARKLNFFKNEVGTCTETQTYTIAKPRGVFGPKVLSDFQATGTEWTTDAKVLGGIGIGAAVCGITCGILGACGVFDSD